MNLSKMICCFALVSAALPGQAQSVINTCYGAEATIQYDAPQAGYMYLWKVNSVVQGSWTAEASFTLAAITEEKVVSCDVDTDGDGIADESKTIAVVSAYADVKAATITGDQTICYNTVPSEISMTVAPTGADGVFTHQWQKNDGGAWSDIIGATQTSYQPSALTKTTKYRLVSTSTYGCGTVISNEVEVVVRPEFVAGSITGDEVICYGTAPTKIALTADCTGGEGLYSYQWQQSADGVSFTDVAGLASKAFIPSELTRSTYFRLQFTDLCGVTESNAVFVQVYDDIKPASISGGQTICYNTVPYAITMTAAPTGADGVFTHQWQKNDVGAWSDIAGATSTSYQPEALTRTTKYRLVSISTYGCGTVISNEVEVVVRPEFVAGSITGDEVICYGTAPTQIAITADCTGGEGTYSYQWQQSADGVSFTDVAGQISKAFTPSKLTRSTYFRLQFSDLCGVTESNAVFVQVYDDIKAATISGDQTICYNTVPNAITMTAAPTGADGMFTHQWQKTEGGAWSDIAGATSTSYQPEALTKTTKYRLVSTSTYGCGTVISNEVEVVVRPEFVAGSITGDEVICYGTAPTQIAITADCKGGEGSYSYQWQQSADGALFTDVAGQTSKAFTPSKLTRSTYFRLQFTDLCGVTESNAVFVQVYDDIKAAAISGDQTICYNMVPSEISMTAAPTGTDGVFTHQWQKNDSGSWIDIMGATQTSYQPEALTRTTKYRLVSTSTYGCGTVISNEVEVVVRPEFVAGSITGDEVICYGTAPTKIAITADCTGGEGSYSYQWQQSADGAMFTDVAGQTSKAFTPSELTRSTYFRLQFTDLCGVTESNAVFVQVYDDIKPAAISGEQTICYNTVPSEISMTAAPTGADGVFTHQWQKNDGGTWSDIAGATSTSYQPSALITTTMYRLVSTSTYGCGMVISNEVMVTVYDEIDAGAISTSQTICYATAPSPLAFSVKPSGEDGAYSYKWYVSADNSAFLPIDGETSSTLAPEALTATRYYKAEVMSHGCGTKDETNVVEVVVRPEFVAGSITGDEVICYGTAPTKIAITADCTGGEGSYSYQWQQSADGVSFTDVAGQTSKAFAPSKLTRSTYFRLQLTDLCGVTESNAVFVQVYGDIKAATISGGQTICYNTVPAEIKMTAAPTGADGVFTHQWQKNDGGAWSDIIGATKTSYQPEALTRTTKYRLVSTSTYGCGTVISNEVTVNVYDEIDAGVISASQTVCYATAPSPLAFSVKPNGEDGAYSYKWFVSVDNSAFSPIDGETSSTLAPEALTTTRYYKAEVTSQGCGTKDETNVVEVVVRPEFVAGSITGDEVICYGTAPTQIAITADCTGGEGSYSYQWQQSADGVSFTDVAGQTSKAFTPSKLTRSTYFRLQFTDLCGVTESNAVFVQVYGDIKAATISGGQTICYNTVPSAITMTAAPTGADGVFTHQWQKTEDGAWSDIVGATSTSYQPSSLTTTTKYRLVSTSTYGCGTVISNEVAVNVYDEIDAGVISASQTVCYATAPSPLAFSVKPNGEDGAYSYKWFVSADNSAFSPIDGETSSTLAPEALTTTRYYKAEVTSQGCGTKDETNVVEVVVRPEFVAGSITGDEVICYGTAPTKIAITADCTGGEGSYSYQWQRSADGVSFTDVAGQTSKAFTPSKLTRSTYFRLQFSDLCGVTESNAVFVQVYDDIKAATISGEQTICYNTIPSAITMTAAPAGADGVFTHQWQKTEDGAWSDIVGATSTSYQPSSLTTTTKYRLVSTSTYGCGTVISNEVTVNVYDEIDAGVISASQTICYATAPSPLAFSVKPSGEDGAYSYRWFVSADNSVFTEIGGAAVSTLAPEALTTTRYYKAEVTSHGCGTKDETNVVEVVVRPEFVAGSITGDEVICAATRSSRKVIDVPFSGGEGDYKYQWQYSTDAVNFTDCDGGEGASFVSPELFQTTYFRLQVTDMCGTLNSNAVEVFVNPLPLPKELIGEMEVCLNSSDVEYHLASDEAEIAYLWSAVGGTIDGDNAGTSLVVDWDTTPSASLTLLQTNERTGCVLNTEYPIDKKSETAPDQTDIVQKGTSQILICAEDGADITYAWGYIDLATGAEHMIENTNYRYAMYPSAIDVSKNIYFVKTSVGSCVTTSLYDPSRSGASESKKSDALRITISPNPVEAEASVSVNADIDGEFVISIIDLYGRMVWGATYKGYVAGSAVPIPIALSTGVYMLSVESADFVLTDKMIVK